MGLFGKKEKVVWRDKNGAIACPGDSCSIDCDNSCPIWLNTMGMTLLQMGQYEKAIETYREGIELAPDFADLWNNMAIGYANINNYSEAYEAYKKAYDLAGRKNALYGLALASRDTGRVDEAIGYCKEYREKFNDGALDSIEKGLVNKENSTNNKLYLDMLTAFLEYASKNGYVEYKGTVPMIPELYAQADLVCKRLLNDIKSYMDSEYGDYDAMRLYDLTANWSLYTGMGAVWHWNKNWEELKSTGIIEKLAEPEGVDCIDDVVLDCVGIGRDSEEGIELRHFAQAMGMVALTVPPEDKMKNAQFIINALSERNKAMYMLGIAMEMHRLGMN